MEELDLDRCLRAEVDWLEVEDVTLHAETCSRKGGTIADVGDGLKAAASDVEAGDVNAEGRELPTIRCEIHRRHKKARTHTAVSRGSRTDGEGVAEHPAGAGHIACCGALADGGAGDLKTVDMYGGMDVHGEAVLCAEGYEFGDSGLGAVTEAEVGAFVEAADAKGIDENGADEVVRGEAGQGGIERKHESRLDSGGGEQTQALANRREQQRCVVRAQVVIRVGVEGESHGATAESARLSEGRGKNLLMAAVDAVEVADGDNGRAEAGRHLGE